MILGPIVRRNHDIAIAVLAITEDNGDWLRCFPTSGRQQQHRHARPVAAEPTLVSAVLLDERPIEGLHVGRDLRTLWPPFCLHAAQPTTIAGVTQLRSRIQER